MSDIVEQVKTIVAEQLDRDIESVTIESSFVDDLGADSLDTVKLIMELEKAFNITMPDDAAEKIATVGDAIKFIEEAQA